MDRACICFALLSNRGLQEGFKLGLARLQDCWFLGWQELNCALSLHCWLDSMDRACICFALLSNRGLQEGFKLGLARLQDCWFLGWQELNCALSLHCWLDSMDRACICLLSYFSSRSTRRLQSRIGKAAGLLVSGLTRAKLCTLLALSCICFALLSNRSL